jgi:hypothetical protein
MAQCWRALAEQARLRAASRMALLKAAAVAREAEEDWERRERPIRSRLLSLEYHPLAGGKPQRRDPELGENWSVVLDVVRVLLCY